MWMYFKGNMLFWGQYSVLCRISCVKLHTEVFAYFPFLIAPLQTFHLLYIQVILFTVRFSRFGLFPSKTILKSIMYVCMYYVCVCVCVCVCVYICLRMYVCIVYVCTTYVLCVCVCIYLFMYLCVHMCVCMYVCVYIYIYI
jgi:hypothetical protein